MNLFELEPKMRHKEAVLLHPDPEFTLRNAPGECLVDDRHILDDNYALNIYNNITSTRCLISYMFRLLTAILRENNDHKGIVMHQVYFPPEVSLLGRNGRACMVK
jgi:hypothetical protein